MNDVRLAGSALGRSGFGVVAMAMVVTMSMTACGSGDKSLDRNKTVATLSTDEKTTLCDQLNGAQGGYGRSVTCASGQTETTDPNQSECVLSTPASGSPCAALTVGTVLDCAAAVGGDLCLFETAPACQPIRTCSGG